MTKEPKLQAAMRIVPEWQDYDQEIKLLQSHFQKEKEMGTPAKMPGQHTHGNLCFCVSVTSLCACWSGAVSSLTVSLYHAQG